MSDTIFWLLVAIVISLLLLSVWDWYVYLRRERTKPPENLRMVDQERPASIVKLASLHGKASKGFSDARKSDRVAGVITPKGEKAS